MTLNNPPIITNICPNPEKPGRIDLYLDDEFYATIPTIVMVGLEFRIGDPFDEEHEERLIFAAQLSYSKEKAFQYLEYGDLSRKKLYEKLTRFGIDPRVAERTCDDLEKINLIDDEKLAASLADRLYRGKHYGPKRIYPELLQRGIPSDLAKEAIDQLEREDEVHLTHWMERKYPLYDLKDPKQRNKVFQGLCRYGFSFDEINHVLRKFSEDFE